MKPPPEPPDPQRETVALLAQCRGPKPEGHPDWYWSPLVGLTIHASGKITAIILADRDEWVYKQLCGREAYIKTWLTTKYPGRRLDAVRVVKAVTTPEVAYAVSQGGLVVLYEDPPRCRAYFARKNP